MTSTTTTTDTMNAAYWWYNRKLGHLLVQRAATDATLASMLDRRIQAIKDHMLAIDATIDRLGE